MTSDNRPPLIASGGTPAPHGVPDPYGEAAMLLLDSLIHGLVMRSALDIEEAIDLVTVAIDARIEIVADRGEVDEVHDRTLALLSAVRASLAIGTGR